MPFRSLEQGISAVQQGNLTEGARLLKIALKSPELQGILRATALAWLAETKHSRQEKVATYQEALQVDPNNEQIRLRLSALLAADLPPLPIQNAATVPHTPLQETLITAQTAAPPPPPPTLPDAATVAVAPTPTVMSVASNPTVVQPATAPKGFYRTVGIVDGPNGVGTGFFVTREGLVATTRLVVGGLEQVTVELEPGLQVAGKIVRSYPEYDLALVETGTAVSQLLPVTPQPIIPENTPLTAFAHNGRVIPGQRRDTKSDIRPDWFPTTITQLFDVGGNPVFDHRNFLVGMLTRNASRTSSHVYGLLIGTIYRCVELYLQELHDGTSRAYCPSCGQSSRAAALGGHYCEMCGSVLPGSRNVSRFPTPRPQVDVLYGETIHRPCRSCGSRVGYYNGRCLRCGTDITVK